jgi:hypothetical protein
MRARDRYWRAASLGVAGEGMCGVTDIGKHAMGAGIRRVGVVASLKLYRATAWSDMSVGQSVTLGW